MTMPAKNPHIALVLSNPLNHEGGVANFVRLLLANPGTERFKAMHHPLGSRMNLFYAPIRKRLIYPILYIWDLLSIARSLKRNPDIRVVHVNPSLIPVPLLRDGPALLLARLFKRRSVVMFHGWKQDFYARVAKGGFWLWFLRSVYARADAAVVLGSAFRDQLVALGFDGRKIQCTTTMYDRRQVVAAPKTLSGQVRLLYLGRVSRLKGMDDLIAALTILKTCKCDFAMVIAGHEGERGELRAYRAMIEDRQLASLVSFPGRIENQDRTDAYANADIYVLPSLTEGCPTAVLEALGNGLFVIATHVGGLPDVIEEGVTGMLVPAKDPKTLAAALIRACENIEAIRKRRSAIRRRAESKYESEVVSGGIFRIYESVERPG